MNIALRTKYGIVSVDYLANNANTADYRSHLTPPRANYGSGWPVPRRAVRREAVCPGPIGHAGLGKVFDAAEIQRLVDASLDFWLTTGGTRSVLSAIACWMGVRECVLTDSGSSANLLAISALTPSKLGDRRLVAGDEIITAAAGFPTTVNPILQNNLVPVFVDVSVPTYHVDPAALGAALSPRIRA